MIVLNYLIVGLVTVFGVALIHLIIAEQKGYDALKYWNTHDLIFKDSDLIKAIFGLMIWPIRVIEFIATNNLYELYDRKY